MNAIFRLDRARNALHDESGARFDGRTRTWGPATAQQSNAAAEVLDPLAAVTWLQRESGTPCRVPIGVIGPRQASDAQLALARAIGEALARCGLAVICGGREGIMQATCEGVARANGVAIGLLPEPDPAVANPYVTVAIATGIGEARNALIARASLCLVAIGNSFGTLSEVALGRQFGKRVVGLEGAAEVEGVVHVPDVASALQLVAGEVLGRRAP